MVKITFRPWREIIIHESIQFPTLDEIIRLQSVGSPLGGLARPLNWAEGVVFTFSTIPPTEDVVREQLQGKVHWSSVAWALMPKYQRVIVIKETNVRIPINDVSANEILSEVARSLLKISK